MRWLILRGRWKEEGSWPVVVEVLGSFLPASEPLRAVFYSGRVAAQAAAGKAFITCWLCPSPDLAEKEGNSLSFWSLAFILRLLMSFASWKSQIILFHTWSAKIPDGLAFLPPVTLFCCPLQLCILLNGSCSWLSPEGCGCGSVVGSGSSGLCLLLPDCVWWRCRSWKEVLIISAPGRLLDPSADQR